MYEIAEVLHLAWDLSSLYLCELWKWIPGPDSQFWKLGDFLGRALWQPFILQMLYCSAVIQSGFQRSPKAWLVATYMAMLDSTITNLRETWRDFLVHKLKLNITIPTWANESSPAATENSNDSRRSRVIFRNSHITVYWLHSYLLLTMLQLRYLSSTQKKNKPQQRSFTYLNVIVRYILLISQNDLGWKGP